MKKLTTVILLFAGIGLIASCGKKATPEEEVRNYGKYFVEKINANQLDSLTASYPDISKADSIVPLQSDSIVVTEVAPGQFDVTLAEGVTLKVNCSDDGNISVTESKGLFAFPDDKMDIAGKTGMWNANISDVQLAERMNDEDFFKWLNDTFEEKVSKIITIGKFQGLPFMEGGTMGFGSQTLTNTSDVDLDGSEYSIVASGNYIDYGGADGVMEEKINSVSKGYPIKAHGTKKETDVYSGHHGSVTINKIKWNLSPDQLREKFVPYTGKEYQEYLDSKK